MPFIICVMSQRRCGGLLVIHFFEVMEKLYFTIDFLFAGSIASSYKSPFPKDGQVGVLAFFGLV